MKTWKEEINLTENAILGLMEIRLSIPQKVETKLRKKYLDEAHFRTMRLLVVEMVRSKNPQLHNELRELVLSQKDKDRKEVYKFLVEEKGIPGFVAGSYRVVYLT